MRKWLIGGAALLAVSLALPTASLAGETNAAPVCDEATLYCPLSTIHQPSSTLQSFPMPVVAGPNPPIAPAQCTTRKSGSQIVNYKVATKGHIAANLDEFKAQVQETYDAQCGWARLGVTF